MKKAPIFLILIFLFNGLLFADFKPTLLGVMYGKRNGDLFGRELNGVGDINGDGYDDFMVAAHGIATVYLYFGSANFDTTADMIIKNRGSRIISCDFNGDGQREILIGSPSYQEPGTLTKEGIVYLFFTGDQLDDIPDLSFQASGGQFGWSLAAGDVNGDGYDDILISAEKRVYLFLGSKEMDTKPDAVFYGGGGIYGDHIACGDINNDGYDDIVTDAIVKDRNTLFYSFIYFGGRIVDTKPDIVLNAYGSAAMGDFNDDSFSDVMISTSGVFWGARQMDPNVDVKIQGYTVASGYFNRDKYEDILIGNWNDYGGLGAAYVYLGGNPMDSVFDWGGMGRGIGNFGFSVANAGDVNGDGVDDMLIGEPGYYFDRDQGRVFLLSGDTSMVSVVAEQKEHGINDFCLYPNYPNPFSPGHTVAITHFRYALPRSSHVTIDIFNELGQKVRTLECGKQQAGIHTMTWDGRNNAGQVLPMGAYFYRIRAGKFTATKKLLLLK